MISIARGYSRKTPPKIMIIDMIKTTVIDIILNNSFLDKKKRAQLATPYKIRKFCPAMDSILSMLRRL